jgi:hypothetical protein
MFSRRFDLTAVAAATGLALAVPAHATAVINTFTGPWAPVAGNGFANATSAPQTFKTSVTGNGTVLTSAIANNGDTSPSSFFLQNYNFLNPALPQLPYGVVRYDYSIALSSPTGSVAELDDFGHNQEYTSGTTITGHQALNYLPPRYCVWVVTSSPCLASVRVPPRGVSLFG